MAAKASGINFISVTTQFWILAAFDDKPDTHINHVDTPKLIKTTTYQCIEKPKASCNVMTM
jgi:hypothetical protein